jgi:hypothetical protein
MRDTSMKQGLMTVLAPNYYGTNMASFLPRSNNGERNARITTTSQM